MYHHRMSAAYNGRTISETRELPVNEAQTKLAELLKEVEDGDFIYLTSEGERVAVLMPADIGMNYEKMKMRT